MTDILDAEELEAAIRRVRARMADGLYAASLVAETNLILKAAEITSATLPRWEEIEVETWRVYDKRGQWRGYESSKADAQEIAGKHPGWQAVRLTGTAKVRA